jgi:AmiR/NasT family two-component response regulator
MAGFRIRQGGQKVGALNVFSDAPGALTEHSLEQAVMLTAFASVALSAYERGEEAGTLRRGLESNREIGKAIGLLMAMHGIDDEQAFQMLAKVSQEMNVKLAEVASRVISHHRSES